MIKLIALDVDGTPVDANNMVSPANEMAVKKALSRGIKVVLATGRHRDGVKKVMEVMGLYSETLLIANNGARSYPYLCEINSGRCDKGRSLKILCEKLGISPEEVLAVGMVRPISPC